MIFNVNTSGESLKLPTLDMSYPQDVNVTYIPTSPATATFTAAILSDGVPALYTYQWYVDDQVVAGATNPTYTISNANTAGTHSVYCKITNKAGSVNTRVATLTVTLGDYAPVLNSAYPADVNTTYSVGGSTSATFKVEIATAGNPESYTYQWYVDGTAVSGATSSTYTRSGLNSAATHNVYCVVTNAAGSVTSRTAKLTVTIGSLAFFNGTLNTSTFGTISGVYSVTSSKLKVNGNGGGSTTSNSVTHSKAVDLTNYKTLTLVVPTNNYTKCAVRINDSSDKQVAATTITASNTGTFNIDLSKVSGSCKLVLDASSNSSSDHIMFSSIIFYP